MIPGNKREERLLVYAEDPGDLKVLGRLFWDSGWDIAFARDEKSFFKRLKILPFDLVLVNAGVAGFDCESFCERLNSPDSGENRPPVILLVPPGIEFFPGRWLDRGLADYVRGSGGQTPWDYSEILARARNHRRHRKNGDELKKKISLLENSNRDKDSFYRILSHDLKAPFQGLVGLLEVLHGEYDTLEEPEVRGYIRNVHDATKRTYRLLENLLEWSGLQEGQLKWAPEDIDLNVLVEDVLEVFRIGARDKGITLSSDIEPGLTVFADIRMISSVIRNLVYNGIKFTDRNGYVLVRAKESVDYYEISVDDSGVGVQPDNLNKLLRGGAADSTPGTAQESGSGLGLKICRQFIEMNGGQMWVRSNPEEGSSFMFSLPKRKVDLSIIGESSLQLIGPRTNPGGKK